MNGPPSAIAKRFVAGLFLLTLLFTIGCTQKYRVEVKSKMSDSMNEKLRYSLVCVNEGGPIEEMFCEDAKHEIENALNRTGMISVPREDCDVIISFEFKVEEQVVERKQFRGMLPPLKTNVGNVVERNSDGTYNIGPGASRTDFSRKLSEVKVVTYDKTLTLLAFEKDAVENGNVSPNEAIWKAKAAIQDSSVDLYPILNYLSEAAVQQLGGKGDDKTRHVSFPAMGTLAPRYKLVVTEL